MKSWILLILFFSASLFAGDGAGKGDAVQCITAGKSNPLRLLDFFERDPTGGFKPSLGSTGSITDKALFAIERIKTLDPTRYTRYHDMANTFLAKARMVKGPLYDYNDTGPLSLPANCSLVPVSIQRPPIDPSDKPFTVDTAIWGTLPTDDERAGVILHEVVYNETLSLGQETSESARKFTGLLASDEFDTIDQADYTALTNDLFVVHQPKFVSDVINLNAYEGSQFAVDLYTLLQTVPNRTLSWGTTSDRPAWLNLDPKGHRLYGMPGADDLGATQFDLVVRDEAGEALALVQLNVLPALTSLPSSFVSFLGSSR
jgi:hypothetical protein